MTLSAGNCPKAPTIERTHSVPMISNEGAATQSIADSFMSFFGPNYLRDFPAVTGSEDFSNLATAIDVPYCFWFFGGHETSLFDKHYKAGTTTELPVNHSPYFAPAIHPTLQTGIDALVVAVMTHLYSH